MNRMWSSWGGVMMNCSGGVQKGRDSPSEPLDWSAHQRPPADVGRRASWMTQRLQPAQPCKTPRRLLESLLTDPTSG